MDLSGVGYVQLCDGPARIEEAAQVRFVPTRLVYLDDERTVIRRGLMAAGQPDISPAAAHQPDRWELGQLAENVVPHVAVAGAEFVNLERVRDAHSELRASCAHVSR